MGEGEGTCSSASPNLRFLAFPVSPFPQPAFHRAAQVALMGATYLYNEESTAVITGCLVFSRLFISLLLDHYLPFPSRQMDFPLT